MVNNYFLDKLIKDLPSANKNDLETILELRYLYNSSMSSTAFYLYQTVKPLQSKYYYLYQRYYIRSIEFYNKLEEYRRKKYNKPKVVQLTLF